MRVIESQLYLKLEFLENFAFKTQKLKDKFLKILRGKNRVTAKASDIKVTCINLNFYHQKFSTRLYFLFKVIRSHTSYCADS